MIPKNLFLIAILNHHDLFYYDSLKIRTIYSEIFLNSNCKPIEYIFPIQNCAISLLILTYTNLSSHFHKM